MPTTSNFGWTTPADTDLVKDGAAAIRTLGNGIDTSLVDLKGGTTDQVLAKNSNSDLDFKWVAQDDSNAIQNALLTTTGDIIYASAASTPARLGLGTANQVLRVNSGATAPEWATPAAGGAADWTLLNTGGTALTGAATITVSSISGKDKIWILIDGASSANAGSQIRIRLNTDTGTNYYAVSHSYKWAATYASSNYNSFGPGAGGTSVGLADMSNNAGSVVNGSFFITGCNATGVKVFNSFGGATEATGVDPIYRTAAGYYNSASTISSVSAFSTSGNFDAGTIYVYTSA